MIDVCIIGFGPAGISCALYLKRLNYNVVVIGKDTGKLTNNDLILNYYGTSGKILGSDLIENGIKQALELNIDVKRQTVYDVLEQIDHYTVVTCDEKIDCKSVVLATGKNRIGLNVEGFNKYRGKGIHFCASCDAFFFRNKKIFVIGHGKYLDHELSYIKHFTKNISIVTSDSEYTNDEFEVINKGIKSFSGGVKLEKITLDDDTTHEVDGCFIALGFPSSLELADKMGIITEKGNILVDENMQTNLSGIFACGDVIGGRLQVAKAVYDGLLCSEGVHKFIKDKKK